MLCIVGNVECRPESVSLSPGTQEVKLYSVQGGVSEWVINRERENTQCGMQGRLCVRLGVSLPFLKKSKAPRNKVDEVACGQVCCEIKSLYLLACYLCQMPHKRLLQQITVHDQGSDTKCVKPKPWPSGVQGHRMQHLQKLLRRDTRQHLVSRHVGKTRPVTKITLMFYREHRQSAWRQNIVKFVWRNINYYDTYISPFFFHLKYEIFNQYNLFLHDIFVETVSKLPTAAAE